MHGDEADFDGFLAQNLQKGILRFITCGSVDDGKSTLIGRLLYDSAQLYEDHLAALHADSRRFAPSEGTINFALLLDGLQEEREQGITIDVAYRYFSTEKRSFIIADTPGHEQYTRNMATGASRAELAVILVDVRNGIQRQTRRHSRIVAALGIRSIVLAVNKMDLVDYRADIFDRISAEYQELLPSLGNPSVLCIPISALKGDNVVTTSSATPWYHGPSLLDHLETVDARPEPSGRIGMRFPVQLTLRAEQDFRGYAGTLASGEMRVGDEVMVLPNGTRSRVVSLLNGDHSVTEARSGEAIAVTLEDDVDAGRGSILVSPGEPMTMSDRLEAEVVWMSERSVTTGDQYDARIGNQWTQVRVARLVSHIDVNTGAREQSDELSMNDIGVLELLCASPVAFDAYSRCRRTGSFILVDRITNRTAGAGMILAPSADLAPGNGVSSVFWHHQSVGKRERSAQKRQNPCIVWFTGLSGAGKSTLANALEKSLTESGCHTYLLDGDNLRHGLNSDLGFDKEDRAENIRRVGEVAKLMLDAGLIVLCAFVSPYRKDRDAIRSSVEKTEFVEVYVSTPLEVCESRDTKGLYARARAGALAGFTGINDPYEPPDRPEVELDMGSLTVEEGTARILDAIRSQQGRPRHKAP